MPQARPPLPVLLRVCDGAGAAAPAVDVEVTWLPSGIKGTGRHRTAHGLCVIPWRGDERRALIEVSGPGGQAALAIDRDRADGGRVRDVALTPSRTSSMSPAT